jgi:four helix bundle protein
MDGYKSLDAWRLAEQLSLGVLEATDQALPPRAWAVSDQLRRAAISVDVNLVEGYALGTAPLFRRHVRIALGSAAEAQRLLAISSTRDYLPASTVNALLDLADRTVACLVGLLRSQTPFRRSGSRDDATTSYGKRLTANGKTANG